MSAGASAFAGYAYYSTDGDGIVYAFTNSTAPTTLGTPVVVVNSVSKAAHFFQFLFLVAGGALTLVLLILVGITFCCRRRVASLEGKYWRLQHAYAEVNNAIVQEILHRTPRQTAVKRQSSSNNMPQHQHQQPMQRNASTYSMRSQHQQQQQPQQQQQQPMQRNASTYSVRSQHQQQQQPQAQQQQQQPVPMVSPYGYPQANVPWSLTSDPVGVYPPPQVASQPLFPSVPTTNANSYDYNTMYNAAPPIHPMQAFSSPQPIMSPSTTQQQSLSSQRQMDASVTSPSASSEGLRRRESRVRFVNTN
ncbi:hypothetical protein ABB37_08376 [Leptomonas pyrrhocoris]|uniref:Uncharacterized protein n=1 Tax=Leptomonas pyrrhocoris TaxID=157538 RepID=A0A0N0DS58_LEPPY|nr:hypothetical protein ABB37_08376 [Leptomonas pyrrhocoris]KPA75461.1 hypothetical protein ABB37_08376 [Leptomonas pyrrhocoris]|eukprot:XP_015653900.1 hypothetical protein ABB37_08376 [Leptomonas pyrrhocoris]